MTSSPDKEHLSDTKPLAATTDPKIVMAEQNTHHVVKEALSMGGRTPVDDTASTTISSASNGEAPSGKPAIDPKSTDAPPTPTTTNATPEVAAAADAVQPPEAADGDVTASATTTESIIQADAPPSETKEHLVNGDGGEHSAAESQAVADGSTGSDEDISRPSSVDQAKRPVGHFRANSIKKPASFKSVSVTKNFLAKSAVATPTARPGEKPATPGQLTASTQLTAKPRLVAKSGSGNVPRALGKLNGAGSGPDASKVWNKNQPVPIQPPKQFTDEELKQHYGIHLTARLPADETGKEAKWADIDDDEDDWAPETVQWMDGTKSTVAAVEDLPPPPPEEPAPPPTKDIPVAAPRPPPTPVTNVQKPSVTGGPKTILKPGSHSQANASNSKGQQDKPSLVAKPSSTAPVKSPWAALPPVEKVSPVSINPPVQPPPSRFSRDSQGHDNMLPPLAPTEIAPDDFNRTWRDDRGNRELYNSHSGRYEPVRDMRRGSMRDSNFRQQPSVLQRPAHDGPAEPSAAFQTSRTSADGPTWGRRRNSSNVSVGSGRRMSFDTRGPDLPSAFTHARRESQSTPSVDPVAEGSPRHSLPPKPVSVDQQTASQGQNPSPSASHVQPASPLGSVVSQEAGTPGGPPQMQNLVEVQQRLLHDNLDTIKLRKQKEREREAKEEADRKERLRLKMESLGFSNEPKPKAEESPSRSEPKSAPKDKAVPAQVQSPPKPPVPTSEGEVAQYGMMKVHQAQPVKKSLASESTVSASKLSTSPVKVQPDMESKPVPQPSPSQPPTTLTREEKTKLPIEQSQAPVQQPAAPVPQGSQSSQSAQAPWSTSLPREPRGWTSNVWGPPQAKARALGNGTFTQQVVSQAQPAPAPIGVNPVLKQSPSQPQVTPSQPFAQQGMYPQAGPPGQVGTAPKPGPIAPPVEKVWGNFQARIHRDDQEKVKQAQRDFERLGGETFHPEMRETYTDQQGKSQTTLHSKIGGVDASASQPTAAADLKSKDEGSSLPPTITQGAHLQPTAPGARASRFFPRPSETASQASVPSGKDDSPPPPETQLHPVFGDDAAQPVVKIPNPPARVRLPPAAVEAVAPADATVSMPQRARVGIGARPLALTQEWQARFNSLLEKPSASAAAPISVGQDAPVSTVGHAKPSALAVASSSKAPLEVRDDRASTGATVSLPASTGKRSFAIDNSSEVTTRASADFLLEDREFGSLPTVRLSKVRHLAANEPPVGFPPTPRQNSRYSPKPALDTFTKPIFNGEFDKHSDTIDIRIRVGSMKESITKSVPRKRKGGNGKGPGQAKPKRNFSNSTNGSPTNGQNQNQRPRKPSGYQNQGSSSASSPRPTTGNAWSNNNNNNRPAPAHLSQPWSRRPAPAAPVH